MPDSISYTQEELNQMTVITYHYSKAIQIAFTTVISSIPEIMVNLPQPLTLDIAKAFSDGLAKAIKENLQSAAYSSLSDDEKISPILLKKISHELGL